MIVNLQIFPLFPLSGVPWAAVIRLLLQHSAAEQQNASMQRGPGPRRVWSYEYILRPQLANRNQEIGTRAPCGEKQVLKKT